MNQDFINQLHQDLCQCYRELEALEQKWYPEALFKTRLKKAQRDKSRWDNLTNTINAFQRILLYYGYIIGPNFTLVKEA